MALISLHEISLAYGGTQLFDRLSFQLEPGERVALLGRNGTGKTTLMKIMAGAVKPDGGKVDYSKGVKVAHLTQDVPADALVIARVPQDTREGWAARRRALQSGQVPPPAPKPAPAVKPRTRTKPVKATSKAKAQTRAAKKKQPAVQRSKRR